MSFCAVCGYQGTEPFKFCPECGGAATTSTSEERKVVTVLFCDVVGSTGLGESIDPEALRGLLARYFDRMQAIAELHGGTVELVPRDGDGTIARLTLSSARLT